MLAGEERPGTEKTEEGGDVEEPSRTTMRARGGRRKHGAERRELHGWPPRYSFSTTGRDGQSRWRARRRPGVAAPGLAVVEEPEVDLTPELRHRCRARGRGRYPGIGCTQGPRTR
jgi:hypothetical protein